MSPHRSWRPSRFDELEHFQIKKGTSQLCLLLSNLSYQCRMNAKTFMLAINKLDRLDLGQEPWPGQRAILKGMHDALRYKCQKSSSGSDQEFVLDVSLAGSQFLDVRACRPRS